MTNPRVSYQTIEFGKIDIHLCALRNNQEFHDPRGQAENLGISSAAWPIFGIVWPSGLVLAHHLFNYKIGSRRVLEVGCGTAISSLLLNKLHVDITATDYHPEVQNFLIRNTMLNGDRHIPFERTDWNDHSDSLGRFDLIVGSDLLYEDEHVELLAEFIVEHSNQKCEVVLVDPGRGRKTKLANRLIESDFEASISKVEDTKYLDKSYSGFILKFTRGH